MPNPKYTQDEILETILMRAIRDEMNSELIKSLKDKDYIPQLSPVEFESEEHRIAYLEYWNNAINRKI